MTLSRTFGNGRRNGYVRRFRVLDRTRASAAAEIGHISPSPRHRSNQRADSPLCDARHERCHEGNIKVAVRWKIDVQGNGTIGPADIPGETQRPL